MTEQKVGTQEEWLGTGVAGYVTTEGPGFVALALRDGVVHHTYTAYAPGLSASPTPRPAPARPRRAPPARG
jgi:hypothetical protein